MRILIATGIYPPQIGGPAEYAYNLEKVWKAEGHKVTVKYYGRMERILPSGLRHLYYLLKSLTASLLSDRILVLDTFSVALPIAILSFISRKKFAIRVGGDFLWEAYVERTKRPVLFRDFYISETAKFNKKEKFIFKSTRWILGQAEKVVFSTDWQRQIWNKPYKLDLGKTEIIANYIGERIDPLPPKSKVFIGSTRDCVWKNKELLREIFDDTKLREVGARLDLDQSDHDEFLERIRKSYAVILASLGDISPNMILDAIRCGKPFISTEECGLYEKLKDIGIWVDPLNKEKIKEKILWLCDENNYQNECVRIATYKEVNPWKNISRELLKNHEIN